MYKLALNLLRGAGCPRTHDLATPDSPFWNSRHTPPCLLTQSLNFEKKKNAQINPGGVVLSGRLVQITLGNVAKFQSQIQ